MGDPITAGAVGSVIAPSIGVINPLTASMAAGAAGAGMGSGSLFGFDPTLGGIGQGVMEAFKTTPFFGQGGMVSNIGQAAGAYNQFGQALGLGQRPRMPGVGASIRPGSQIQPVDYISLLNPQQQTVIRPATPSLI